MGSVITLIGDGGSLLLEPAVNEYGWTLCSLVVGDQHTYLGADTLPRVISGLLDAVGDNDSESARVGELHGYSVRYIMVLSEAHHALYAAKAEQDRLLFWQNAAVEPMTVAGTIRLSPDAAHQWWMQLMALRTHYSASLHSTPITKEIAEIGGVEALK